MASRKPLRASGLPGQVAVIFIVAISCLLIAVGLGVDAGAATVMPSFNLVDGVSSAASPYVLQELLRKERTQRLLLAVRRMSEIDCSLFYRKYYYLQSAAQMAAELGLTERGVEGRLRRIRLRLRKELGGEWNV